VELLWRKDQVQGALKRLDRLTKEEGLMAVVQILGVVYSINAAIGGAQCYMIGSRYFLSSDPGDNVSTENIRHHSGVSHAKQVPFVLT